MKCPIIIHKRTTIFKTIFSMLSQELFYVLHFPFQKWHMCLIIILNPNCSKSLNTTKKQSKLIALDGIWTPYIHLWKKKNNARSLILPNNINLSLHYGLFCFLLWDLVQKDLYSLTLKIQMTKNMMNFD